MKSVTVGLLALAVAAGRSWAADENGQLKVRVSWGHRTEVPAMHFTKVTPREVEIADTKPVDFEPSDRTIDGAWQTRAGGGDVDGLELTIRFEPVQIRPVRELKPMWRDLVAWSDADTARRLRQDPALRPDSRRLTFELNREGTRGFSVTIDQLLTTRVFWIPSLDMYIDAGTEAVPFEEHLVHLVPFCGKRILERIHDEPEATYEQFKARWEDMGSPRYKHPAQPAPGHIVCLTWDSAIPKYGIDRGAGVWNDYGNPDRFRFWFDFGDLDKGIADSWKGQRLIDGFPIVATAFEKDGIRYEVEQFAHPLNGPPPERRGDIPMVLLQKVRVTELRGQKRSLPIMMSHARRLPAEAEFSISKEGDAYIIENASTPEALLSIEGVTSPPRFAGSVGTWNKMSRHDVAVTMELAPHESMEFVIELPSPPVAAPDHSQLAGLDYETARAATLQFWRDYEARGARFRVPEEAVNELFRANLWHALRLPRRHGGLEPDVKIDLPYSNFAYDQRGIPWPVNQSVYVDYMIYDLRGYHDIAAEELAAIFRENQEADGHIKGFANWLVYTPSTLYVVAKNYLFSHNREAFEQLLPASLKTMDWCLNQVRQAQDRTGSARGLIHGPLNDGSGEGFWAFNQAYMYAGLDLFGRALQRYGHPRAEECLAAADAFGESVERAYRVAAVQSPLVQLRDHTWIPYVPCEVTQPGRLLNQWYPTDVDTGAVHLLRLQALSADGDLAESLLNDHEGNLYLHGWGMANEPVYNPQGTAYLLRDDPKAVIRTFYSMMACAFSHSVFESVEHRWTHGQYFCPPSTDGAWAELYRNMLVHELRGDTLFLFAATPRKWLESGKTITIENAPTYYGKLSARLESHADTNRIEARIQLAGSDRPKAIVVRFRHPQASPMRSVRVNGNIWTDFDAQKEWVHIAGPAAARYAIEAAY